MWLVSALCFESHVVSVRSLHSVARVSVAAPRPVCGGLAVPRTVSRVSPSRGSTSVGCTSGGRGDAYAIRRGSRKCVGGAPGCRPLVVSSTGRPGSSNGAGGVPCQLGMTSSSKGGGAVGGGGGTTVTRLIGFLSGTWLQSFLAAAAFSNPSPPNSAALTAGGCAAPARSVQKAFSHRECRTHMGLSRMPQMCLG